MSFWHDQGRVYFGQRHQGRPAELGIQACENLRNGYAEEFRCAMRHGDHNGARVAYILFHELQDAMRACLAYHCKRGTAHDGI